MSRVTIGQEYHALVQHLVVLQVVQQRVRHAVERRRQEHRGARRRASAGDASMLWMKRSSGIASSRQCARISSDRPRFHVVSSVNTMRHPDDDREPAAFGDLERVRREERRGRSATSGIAIAMRDHIGQFHSRRMTTKIRIESISIASVTAMP